MAANWSFRTILNVYPESDSFTCVSTRPDNPEKCHNRRPLLSEMDLAKAGEVLDTMDRCESLKSSYRYLDELARLTLCIIHSEGDGQIERVSTVWQDKIEQHMRLEIDIPVRPKTRRSVGRRRTSSITVMTVLKEEKAEQSPISASKSPASKIPVPIARQDSSTSTWPRPTKNMSRKISSLISEVGFQDSSNEQFLATMQTPKTPTQAPPVPPVPTRGPPIPPARRVPSRSKTYYPPVEGSTQDDQWSSYPILSLLTRSSTLLKSDEQIEDQTAKTIEAQIFASRPRTHTISSTGSSTARSKTSSADSDSGSSAPTSQSSSANNSPHLKPTEDNEMKPFPAFPLPPGMVAKQLSQASPEQPPLPTFDFGIFQTLPLPPGHKQSISNKKDSNLVLDTKILARNADMGKVPPRTFEYDSSRPSFALNAFEKPRSRRQSEVTQSNVPETKDDSAFTTDYAEAESAELIKVDTTPDHISETPETGEVFHEHIGLPAKEPITLLECDSVSMISTSWLNSPRLSRASSILSTGRLSRTSSQSRSPPLTRTASLSRAATLSRSSSTSGKPSRTPSFSFSRSLSRTLSRRSSTKTSPKIDEEKTKDAITSTTSSPPLPRRANSTSTRKAKEDTISLPRLIQMSHELARRLDGYESHGYVEIRPSTTYKYHLPSSSSLRRSDSSRSTTNTTASELRLSKLFMGLSTDMDSFPYVSPNFPFSIPVSRKPIAERGAGNGGRSRSVGTASDERPTHQQKAVFVRPEMNLAQKLAPIPKTGPRQTTVSVPPVPPLPVSEVEVCAICGNTQSIWGRCDCGTPGSARGKVGSLGAGVDERDMTRARTRTRTRTPDVGERPVVLGKMERRPTKRVPKRASTLRRIRRRVVRAFTL